MENMTPTVSKDYITVSGFKSVKCTMPGKFKDLECDITDEGTVRISFPDLAGYEGYNDPSLKAAETTLTAIYKNQQNRLMARKQRKVESCDKNTWYTKNDSETNRILEELNDFAVDFMIDYLDNNKSNKLYEYYCSLLNRIQCNKFIYKALPMSTSNKLPIYDANKDRLSGSQNSFLLLLRTIYPASRRGTIHSK